MKPVADWISGRVFKLVHGSTLVYNACWEDPRLDREVMHLDADSEIVMITSAGCNALDYALDAPCRIDAVDINYRQNALLQLKIAGVRTLEYEEFFALFGEGGHRSFPRWYLTRLRPWLDERAQHYWDRHQHYFARGSSEDSFYLHGATGRFAQLMQHYLRIARVYADAARLFAARELAEQNRIYHDSIRNRLWTPGIKRALGTDIALSLLGVPQSQREHLERTYSCGIAEFMERCVEHVLTRLPVHDNYFWRLYLFGRYSPECCPAYLQRDNFERLRSGLIDRIFVHTTDITTFLRSHDGAPSHLVLLDHMDWLSHTNPDALGAEWQAIVDRARPGARILWRSGGLEVDYVDPIDVNRRGTRWRVGDLLRYERDLAQQCQRRDRVHTYGSFYIADLAA